MYRPLLVPGMIVPMKHSSLPPTKLREGSVFVGVCLFKRGGRYLWSYVLSGEGVGISGRRSFLGVDISGRRSLPFGGMGRYLWSHVHSKGGGGRYTEGVGTPDT